MALTIVEKNVLSNFLARIWAGLISIALIPVYIQYMGVEAYGLVGIFVSLQTLLLLLDLGLGATISREFARFSKANEKSEYLLDLLKTLEVFYWAMGAVIALTVVSLAPIITSHWLSPESLPADTVTTTIKLIGLTIAFQWPSALYSGGMSGLQRQARLSAVVSILSTARYVGAVAVLHFFSPSIEAFFCWQLLIGIIQTPILRYNLMKVFPPVKRKGIIRFSTLAPLWQFATGMLGISILSTLVTQLDKIILSKMLSLEEFGYYSIATAAAGSLYTVVGPVFNAFYPKFSQLYEEGKTAVIDGDFHQGNQILAVALFPVMWLMFFYSVDVLLIWTGSLDLASKVGVLIVPLVVGNTINGLMNIPYAVQLAAGWTRIPLFTNLAGLLLLLPALLHASIKYGAIGAATVWLLFNVIYMIITVIVMQRLAFKGRTRTWLLKDIGLPMIISFFIFLVSSFLVVDFLPMYAVLFLSALAFACTIISAPRVRAIFVPASIHNSHGPNKSSES